MPSAFSASGSACDSRCALGQRFPEGGHHFPGELCRHGHAHQLAEHRTYRLFKRIQGARQTKPRPWQRKASQRQGDLLRIAGQIK